jgi:GDP-4-dehydro-6-deoxy-D-mannose reductase
VAHLGRKVTIDRFDITDADACRRFVIKARPDYLFHLAAFSSVGRSFSKGDLTFRVNVFGTYHILEAVRGRKWLKKLVLVSSSDVYGPVGAKDLPLKPNHILNPVSPYAQSKAAAEYLAQTYADQYGVPVVTVRSFNHSGPRQNPDFVIPAFCRKIVAVERSSRKKTIATGNLSARRDISDVRDIARGYRLLAEKGTVGKVYHLCSGRAYRIGDLLNQLIKISDIHIKVRRDPELYRKTDIPVLQGHFQSTRKDVGWKPNIDIVTTLSDTLRYWRER